MMAVKAFFAALRGVLSVWAGVVAVLPDGWGEPSILGVG